MEKIKNLKNIISPTVDLFFGKDDDYPIAENLNELELLNVRIHVKSKGLTGFFVRVNPKYAHLFEHPDNEYEICTDGVMSDWPTYIHTVIGEVTLFNENLRMIHLLMH